MVGAATNGHAAVALYDQDLVFVACSAVLHTTILLVNDKWKTSRGGLSRSVHRLTGKYAQGHLDRYFPYGMAITLHSIYDCITPIIQIKASSNFTYIATHWVLSLNFFCKDQISLFIARTLEH